MVPNNRSILHASQVGTTLRAVFCFLCFAALILVMPSPILAATYGSGTFGAGTYNTGNSSTAAIPSTSSDTSAANPAVPPSCNDLPPGSAPWLYGAVAQTSSSVSLYFTTASDPVDSYVLEYGTQSGTYQYGSPNIGDKNARTFLLQSLQPHTTYYFRVRAQHGCAPGSWSNELSTTTRNYVSLATLATTQLAVQPGSDVSTGNLNPLPQTAGNPTPSPSPDNSLSQTGYSVKIKVTDAHKNPIAGAKVTLHSTPQTTVTKSDGIADFENVAAGNHQVLISYNGYNGQQNINLTGDTKEFSITVTVEPENILLDPRVLMGAGVFTAVIVVLLALLLISKRSK